MLWTIAVILLVLWALGFFTAHVMGGFIHNLPTWFPRRTRPCFGQSPSSFSCSGHLDSSPRTLWEASFTFSLWPPWSWSWFVSSRAAASLEVDTQAKQYPMTDSKLAISFCIYFSFVAVLAVGCKSTADKPSNGT